MTNKLSCQDKYEIVKLLKSKLKSQRQLARQYNVSKSANLDLAIIEAFKNHYQNYLLEKFILNEKDDIGSNISSVNMLETIYFCSMAWESITCNSIQNCFEKAFNLSQNYSTEISSLELTNAVINNELENMLDDASDVSNTSSGEDDIDDGISLSQIHSIMKSIEDYTEQQPKLPKYKNKLL